MKLHELKEKIIKDINDSQLEIDSIYYLLKAILSDVADLYNNELEKIKNKESEDQKWHIQE